MSASPATGEVMPLASAVQDAAGDLPPVGHLAQGGSFHRRWDFGIDRFHRRQDRHLGRLDPQRAAQVDGVLDDVALVVQRRIDVDRRIGDQQQLGVGRHVHDEDVADPPLGAKAGVGVDHRRHHLVGVQRALHQRLGLAFADQPHRRRRGRVAVRRVDDLEPVDVLAGVLRGGANLSLRADQDGLDQRFPGGLHRAGQRAAVHRMDHGRRDRVQRPRRLDQAGETPAGPRHVVHDSCDPLPIVRPA